MEAKSIEYIEHITENKKNMLKQTPLDYFLRASFAGALLAFVFVMCIKFAQPFHAAGSEATYFVYSLFFGIALILVIFGNAELFTSNTMYFTISTMRKKTTIGDTLKIWTACYIGNFIGAILFAVIFYYAGIFANIPDNHFLHSVVNGKLSADTIQLFFRAILCNWIVCLACFLPTRMQSESAKIITIFLTVLVFFSSGYEHSVANMGLFSIAFFTYGLDVTSTLHNLVPVTLGNIVGGMVFVGMFYGYLNRKK
ncbi:formate/nitrite transporter family protein [Priestia taiwanensis]|uniref:Transporter n=1 Tax=Priestia taiwanensis TaxID=1347902 RepID=A0A917AUM8_9BACI|nr:formate/nitrite transporter family protein [Priestia taiwanensis]MBM7364036.1 nitrite transporter NirC [Priestia taiwanensis]GGE71129.1 transporter [Priestia taiwanensis]